MPSTTTIGRMLLALAAATFVAVGAGANPSATLNAFAPPGGPDDGTVAAADGLNRDAMRRPTPDAAPGSLNDGAATSGAPIVGASALNARPESR